jgi:peptide/nickel transport system substrate-binding protein
MKSCEGLNSQVVSRRGALGAFAAGTIALTLGGDEVNPALAQTPMAGSDLEPEIVIDLAGAPVTIDPALAYAPRDWSIVHALYDAPIAIDQNGEIAPLATKSFEAIDDLTWALKLLPGQRFHDGSAVTVDAVVRSLDHLINSESQATSLFAGITKIDVIDDLTCHLVSAAPSPWLPAQIAVYLVLLPEDVEPEALLTSPIGSGPYMFESQEPGVSISLVRNPNWVSTGAKGWPIAERVTYRFVSEVATRIADLSTGVAQLITEIPHDQMEAILDSSAQPVEISVVGIHFIRIAMDVEPLDRPEVRRALNHAIDAESIAQALVSPEAHRLASLFPDERALGHDPNLPPLAYDPELSRELLRTAGVDTLDLTLEVTTGARVDIAEAIAAQLAEVGVNVTVLVSDYATFNATWNDPSAPALRLVTWAPMFDPQSLLGLVFSSDGYLSRYANAEVDELILAGSVESDPLARQEVYETMAEAMQIDPPAIFLWNLTSGYGVGPDAATWEARGDDYVLPMTAGVAS